VVVAVPAVTAVPEDVEQRAREDQQVGECAEEMRAVFGEEEEPGDREESD